MSRAFLAQRSTVRLFAIYAAITEAQGCDLAQGFLLARPMPADGLGHWLAHTAERTLPPRTGAVAALSAPRPGVRPDFLR